jgi:hypothetical protein
VAAAPVHGAKNTAPHASSVVVIVMENRNDELIVGNPSAPYINTTLIPQAALMTNSHAVTHPSQPNYLALFSGSTQGITDDSCPHEFSAPNLGVALLASGATFTGYSESMPADGYRGCWTNVYGRKHNPWVDFKNVPSSSNRVWHDVPGSRPTVSFIIPNMCNDMHDCSTRTGDAWLKAHLPAILHSGARNDGLLILTWDEAEPDTDGTNRIPTLLLGPMIARGRYSERIDHYAVLHTIERIAKVPCTANACNAPVISGVWR